MEIAPFPGQMHLLLLLFLCPGRNSDPGIEKYSDFGFQNIYSPLWRVTVPQDTCCRWLGLSLVGDLPLVRRSVDLALEGRPLSFSLLLFGRFFYHLEQSLKLSTIYGVVVTSVTFCSLFAIGLLWKSPPAPYIIGLLPPSRVGIDCGLCGSPVVIFCASISC